MEIWQTSLKNGKLVFDVKSRITGCLGQMCKFRFYYSLDIAYKFYSLTDSLSKASQNKKMCAISGQRLARLTITTIVGMRTDRHADNFFDYVKQPAALHWIIEEPQLSRKRKKPTYSRMELLDGYESSNEMFCHANPSGHYRCTWK